MPVVQVLAFVAGAVIVAYTGFAALRTVVLPRAASTMINRIVFIGIRKVFNVLAHERVNEAVMRSYTVIPMSFGTVFKTREDIVELLRGAYEAFTDVLGKMEDKLEYGLKLLWDRDVAVREVEKDDEEVRRLKSEISAQRGSTYFARMQYGRLLEAALQTRSERYVNEIFAQLRDVSVASRANKPIGDRMIMNAAFLVSRDEEGAFDARVKELGSQYDKLTFRYTGPWPPYNFVNIRLKLERAH